MQMLTLQLSARAVALTYTYVLVLDILLPLPTHLLLYHRSVMPGEPHTYPGRLSPRDATCIQKITTGFGKREMLEAKISRGRGNALFGAVNYHLPSRSFVTLPGQLYWKPEFAHCTMGEHTKLYFELFKTSIQLARIMFARNSLLKTSDCFSCWDYIPSLIAIFKWNGFKISTYIT